jgi:UDP-N-acetylmuramyl pentapeptide phosphotransferase/UDP-N-acetylglucosamine-1-phosphate transferase
MPRKKNAQPIDFIRNDIFLIIWIFFIALILLIWYYDSILDTKHEHHLITEMIAVSAIFLIFFLLEPVIRMSHSSKVSQIISKGEYVEPWKRFPIFFFALLIVFGIKHYLEAYLET